MDLLQNPFHILGANSRDSRRRIAELAEERSLFIDSVSCDEARSTLTNPRKRLAAEIAWLPGLSPTKADKIINWLSSPIEALPANKILNGFSPIVKTNIISSGIKKFSVFTKQNVLISIIKLSRSFEDIIVADLCSVINEDRLIAGIKKVTDISFIESEIQSHRRYCLQSMRFALDMLSPRELVEAVTLAVDSATNGGVESGPVLITDLVDSYEIDAQGFLDKEEGNIRALVERLQGAVDAEQPDSVLAPLVSQLIQVVKNWDSVAQPIQIGARSRGLDHDASYRVAGLVRGLAVHMFNEHGKLEFSQQLTEILLEVFAEVDAVAERSAEDADALDEIAEQRARLIEDAKNRTEEWQREITYEAHIGIWKPDRLRISPDGIEWKGRLWPLASITRIRWGATRHSVNGIPTGTTYKIILGNDSNYAFIELKKEAIYSNFIDRLWRAVGARLLTEYLEGLRDGRRYRFGSAVMNDHGIELERKKLFGSSERVFCRWGELVIWNSPGFFCIGKKEDKKLAAAFSYQEEDNVHVLEAAIRMFWKRGGDRLSSLLEE